MTTEVLNFLCLTLHNTTLIQFRLRLAWYWNTPLIFTAVICPETVPLFLSLHVIMLIILLVT